MSKSNQVATRGTTEVSTNLLDQMAGDANQENFSEGMDKNAFALPFLSILQGLSPQVQRGTPQYIPGAAPGLIFNSVTKECVESQEVTVLRRTHTYCFWTPRDSGGGWKGEVPSTDENDKLFQELFAKGVARDPKKPIALTHDGLEMTEHRNFFCLAHRSRDQRSLPVIVSMTKSQLGSARAWNYSITAESFKNVLQSEIWRLGTTMKKKGENQWYVWTATHIGRHSDIALYNEAKAAIPLAEQSGAVNRNLEPTTDEEDSTPL